VNDRQTFHGQISMSPYGKLSSTLFPIKDSGFLDCDDSSLMELFRDMWRFFHSKDRSGKVQGRTVRKGRTPVQKLRTLEFSSGYFSFTMIENARFPDTRVTLIVGIPWSKQVSYAEEAIPDNDGW